MSQRQELFQLRGAAPTRIETFVDAAFAFAMTLLVIGSTGVPTSADALRQALVHIPNFAFCMVLLWVFWSAHERYSRRFGLEDAVSRRLGWLLIFVVLVYVYPLRAVTALTIDYFTKGLISSDFKIAQLQDLEFAFAVCSAGILTLSLIVIAFNVHALRLSVFLQLTDYERQATKYEIGVTLIAVQTAACSLVASLALDRQPLRGNSWVGLPIYLYLLLLIELPLFRGYAMRRLSQVIDRASVD